MAICATAQIRCFAPGRLYGSSGNDILDGGQGQDYLSGGDGHDQFVLRTGSDFDNIGDFQDGTDSFVLTDGLRFEDLTISSYGDPSTLISAGGEPLAVVSGNNVSIIDAGDFTVFECKITILQGKVDQVKLDQFSLTLFSLPRASRYTLC